jgi:hypothetical protein
MPICWPTSAGRRPNVAASAANGSGRPKGGRDNDNSDKVRSVLRLEGRRRCLRTRRVRLGVGILWASGLPSRGARGSRLVSGARVDGGYRAFPIREFAPQAGVASAGAGPYLFIAAALIQALAIMAFLAGRRR